MSIPTALAIFLGIPAALAFVIWLAVSLSSWSKPAQQSPVLVVSDPPAPDPGRLPRERASGAVGSTGGVRGAW
jgi:hypothetical protein